MKRGSIAVMAVLAACVAITPSYGASPTEPRGLITQAEKANAAGDKIAALQMYTEAINAMRLSGMPQDKYLNCLIARDRIAAELISQIPEINKRQTEILQVQRGIDQKINRITQTDKDVQERTKKNENKLKDIEQTLLDAVK